MYLLDNLMKKTFVFGVLYVLFHVFIETNFLRNVIVILAAFSVTGNIFDLLWNFLPKRMLPDIQDKAVLITGCDTGFGYEFAKKLDSLGVLVFAGCLYSEGDGAKELKSSCSGYNTLPNMVSYCMSKHAAVSLSSGLRQELMKWSISVHTIEPWYYRTDIMNDDKIDSGIQKNWDNTAKKVQEEYGEGYLDKIKRTKVFAGLTSRPRSAIHEVVDVLTHATVGRNPKTWFMCSIRDAYVNNLLGLSH
ncbi:retinol dehydrogenase 16-like isoform X2 [Periplaneta americana]|uniref:retinol dehydrogenase 16-like isoform X2 n=1 Tax=Periplaneta americana TaxID=6978 RepID=UPI0037E7C31C